MALDTPEIQLKQISLTTSIYINIEILIFYEEYNGESLLQSFISYLDMKTFYPIQVIDLRFQIDYITPKKIRLFEEFESSPENTNLYVILMKHREINMVSDGNKITGIEHI